jgi:putative membrane protein
MRALAALALLAGASALGLVLVLRPGDADLAWAALCAPGRDTLWTFDAWVIAPLAISGGLYTAGTARLWRRVGVGRGVTRAQAAAYLAGWLALAGALVSPLHRWGEGLFAAHMIEHEVVMAIAAPLLILARPAGALLWALPRAWRHRIGAASQVSGARAAWAALVAPATATLLHGAAIWAWHAPALFDSAVTDVTLHRVQHLAFLVTALLFWWAMLRRSPGAAAGSVALTMLHTSLLGALLALAPRILYPAQTAGAAAWGLTPLEDQQLAGLLMWVPAGTIYAGAALWFAARWIRRSGSPWRTGDAVA